MGLSMPDSNSSMVLTIPQTEPTLPSAGTVGHQFALSELRREQSERVYATHRAVGHDDIGKCHRQDQLNGHDQPATASSVSTRPLNLNVIAIVSFRWRCLYWVVGGSNK